MLSRRDFLKAGTAVGLPCSPLASAVAQALPEIESSSWCACVINCGQRCPVRCFTKKGQVIRIETDNSLPDATPSPRQLRACQRGRSMRERIYSDDRLKYPMKRVGERGEGKFERISWDEAVKTIADNWKRIRDQYGNDAIYWQYCSGQQSIVSSRRAWQRLMNLMGGFLKYYGSYSNAQLQEALPYMLGGRPASLPSEIANSNLYVLFGNNPSSTRPSGGGKGYQIDMAVTKHMPKVIVIDPAFTDTAATKADQWIPIRPGTDAALVAALAYQWINKNQVDQDFLDKYCVGYDEKTLPASAPKNSDYKSYILGNGPDKQPKTPEWASKITGIPVKTIVDLAEEMASTKPLFVSQGWGPQRQANGEHTCRAISMVPILLGQIGLPGTNAGEHEGNTPFPAVYLPVGKNPVKATIPVYMWTDAILRGKEMSRTTDGVKGVEKLSQNIKMIINSGGNTMINQHGDCNWTDKVLRNEKDLEFLVVCDNMMTPSCRYADILLPDTLGPETVDMACQGGSHGDVACMLAIQKAVDPQFEQKPSWEICRLIAKELGLEDAYTEGKSQEDWVRWCYNETRKKVPELPEFDVFWKDGMAKVWNRRKDTIALEAFRKDPVANKIKTPSGKIEIYSEALANRVKDWTLPEGDIISPIPVFYSTWDMPGDPLEKKYPLQCFGYHGHGRIHSTFHNLPRLRDVHPDSVIMNTLDAEARDIKEGDKVYIFNDRGTVLLPARVTPRIMPGVCTIPQGAWFKPETINGQVVDVGGCINTLTNHRPSSLAKGNAQHNILVEIRKA